MKKLFSLVGTLIVFAFTAFVTLHAQQQQKPQAAPMPDCPMMKDGAMKGRDGMTERGDRAMGFSQIKTTHHFLLTKDGGIIQVEANSSDDTVSRNEIRMHLAHIATMFADGNFDIPMFVHDQTPPGVPEMKGLKSEIQYQFEESDRGGRVKITTSNPKALEAIQNFLRFQITEHRTGDPVDITR